MSYFHFGVENADNGDAEFAHSYLMYSGSSQMVTHCMCFLLQSKEVEECGDDSWGKDAAFSGLSKLKPDQWSSQLPIGNNRKIGNLFVMVFCKILKSLLLLATRYGSSM